MVKVHIASSRDIGKKCIFWANKNMPANFEMVGLDDCEIFISIMYDKLLTKNFIDTKTRCVNFHPGILPDYRGSGAFSWSIINREKYTGISLHEIDYNIDSGPLININKTIIHPTDTAETLYNRCMDILFEMFKEYFNKILFGSYDIYPNIGGVSF